MIEPIDQNLLPQGVRARLVPGINGLTMHVLEAGLPDRPCVLLLHGFPELAWSWRKVMPALANAGYYVLAPDQRGYGRTTGWDAAYDGDVASFRLTNLVLDTLCLLRAVGKPWVAAVIGHDFGASVAAWCAVLRPDLFRAVVLMSAPFAGPPSLHATEVNETNISLSALERPRKHYQRYYSTREANTDMWRCQQGVHAFLRGYFHFKSADWPDNKPVRLRDWSAPELARMPTYYIMDRDRGMGETVAAERPDQDKIAACAWLPENDLRIYSDAYTHTGFQGGLQWYRCRTHGIGNKELMIFNGRTIEVPSLFIAGAQDWGVYQSPGAIERMQTYVCAAIRGCHLLPGAGHWVQQEQPGKVNELLLDFLRDANATPATLSRQSRES